jgi:hypothetical protein
MKRYVSMRRRRYVNGDSTGGDVILTVLTGRRAERGRRRVSSRRGEFGAIDCPMVRGKGRALEKHGTVASVVCALAIVAAACGSEGDGGYGEEQPAAQLKQGGTLVIAAEQEGECGDVVGACAQASWGYWHFFTHVLPRVHDVVDSRYRPSELMASEPTVEPGPPMKVGCG